ncbi:molybdopterin oxidoreductase family protein [Candidatus Uabimicrobium amorphum]|uniref:Oxidoreductase n=1 Tax=Uabimicrobium amorphum TaxID=2596890 RepID=A0A5S9IMR3_UABAM|nr:molybdopterin oxidoreductase family protein [Candidatus Uabimicrobium amorphum]BBM83900.1 oxidoreductase [Candidatus Uabimicrobium amorphum]
MAVHYRTCNLCEAMCGLEIHTNNDQIERICGDKKDPFSQGYLCPKGVALQDVYEDKDRLKEPVKRTRNGWQKITWSQAYKEVTQNIKEIQKKHGNDAIALYLGNPVVHNHGSIFGLLFAKSLHTKNRYSASTVDQVPHHLIALKMFGNALLLPVPDVDRTDFFLIMGANPAVSNGSLMSAPNIAKRIKNIQKRGGKVVVIDPMRTRTAELADEHHFIRPGSDVFLLLAMLNVVFSNNWDCIDSLPKYYKNAHVLHDVVAEYTPEKVQEITGISAQNIQQLTTEFCQARSAVCYGRLGVSVQEFGTTTQWLITALNIVTNNFDQPGGAMFSKPAFDMVDISQKSGDGQFASWKSRVRNLPEFNGETPVATLADEILTPGEGQVKALFTVAGNPVLSTPNGEKLDKAIAQLDYVVAVDFYINATTRHANIILPPTHTLEHDHYDFVFLLLAVRNFVKYSPTVFPPPKYMRHDWQIFRELHIRMVNRGLSGKIKSLLLRAMYTLINPLRIIALGLRFGPYGKLVGGLSLRKVKKSVHGIDLGALEACLPQRLMTKDKKVDVAPQLFVEDEKRIASKIHDHTSSKFMLIGRRNLRSNNSWMHNSKRLVKGPNRCTMWINSCDAHDLNIQNGDFVVVTSRVGEIKIEVEIHDKVMPGVVSIPHGWGHGRKGVQLETAQQHAGVSINDLTDELYIDTVSGNAALNGVPVEISPVK